MIPMHAVATDDPQRVRWVIDYDHMPARGRVRRAPGRLGDLQADGVIGELRVDGTDLVITLGPQHSWRARGEEIRVALDAALREPAGWRVDALERTDEIASAVRELLAGPIGELAAAHGGAIELAGVSGTEVRVRMSGACHDCPASESTLYGKLEHELRRRFGPDITVSTDRAALAKSVGKRLLTLFVR